MGGGGHRGRCDDAGGRDGRRRARRAGAARLGLARATGQPFDCDPVHVEAVLGFTTAIAGAGPEAREGLFGVPVGVPANAPALDRALGLAGRDPAWTR